MTYINTGLVKINDIFLTSFFLNLNITEHNLDFCHSIIKNQMHRHLFGLLKCCLCKSDEHSLKRIMVQWKKRILTKQTKYYYYVMLFDVKSLSIRNLKSGARWKSHIISKWTADTDWDQAACWDKTEMNNLETEMDNLQCNWE